MTSAACFESGTEVSSAGRVTAVLVSVGGTSVPIVHVLQQHRPLHVWYFCSDGSRAVADQIHARLDWHPDRDFIEVERFEELGPCYLALRKGIPELLRKWRVRPEEVLVDYTGGTKTMSAALVLAAVEQLQHFSYVGGEQREKAGLGVVLEGRARVVYQANPWAELAIREIERARDLWQACLFDAAAEVLRSVALRVPHRLRFEAIATLCDGLAARHRLDFRGAVKRLHEATGRLRPMFEGVAVSGPLAVAVDSQAICSECAKPEANAILLRELLDNALRTADQGRYEDAAARLYRAMEMQGQLWLTEATDGLFLNGRCSPENLDRLPAALRTLPFCQPDDHGRIRLGLEEVFRALAALGHERARAIVADLDRRDSAGKPQSRWRSATEKRNTSILAHGVTPIGHDGFEQMCHIATEFLGFDLAGRRHPIPSLEPWWFE